MTFLEILYTPPITGHTKGIRILSCEQICGKHIQIFDKRPISEIIEDVGGRFPEKVHIVSHKNHFSVKLPGSSDITRSGSGTSKWYFIRAINTRKDQFSFLCIGNNVWGLETGCGFRMKKSGETHGKDRVAQFLENKVKGVFEDPEQWTEIEIYHQ